VVERGRAAVDPDAGETLLLARHHRLGGAADDHDDIVIAGICGFLPAVVYSAEHGDPRAGEIRLDGDLAVRRVRLDRLAPGCGGTVGQACGQQDCRRQAGE
jgi:hypothetical protein